MSGIPLSSSTTLIGRGDGCAIRPNSLSTSRKHAVILRQDEGWVLVDQDSANGTQVNGESIKRHTLIDGDKIDFGAPDARCTFRNGALWFDEGALVPSGSAAAGGGLGISPAWAVLGGGVLLLLLIATNMPGGPGPLLPVGSTPTPSEDATMMAPGAPSTDTPPPVPPTASPRPTRLVIPAGASTTTTPVPSGTPAPATARPSEDEPKPDKKTAVPATKPPPTERPTVAPTAKPTTAPTERPTNEPATPGVEVTVVVVPVTAEPTDPP